MCYNVSMAFELWWDEQDIAHIRHRSTRYPGATDIEPSETREAAADPDRIVREPDPKSHRNCIRLIGYSPSAGAVLTVIARPSDYGGVTAWLTTGADLRTYRQRSARRQTP